MWRWLSLISLLLVLFIGVSWSLLQEYRSSRKISIIILTVESLRQDLVSINNTPKLLAAAANSFRFANHRAVSGWTGANIVSLLTGVSPFQAGVHTRGQSIDKRLELPLENMAASGYTVEGIQGFMTMDIYKNTGLHVSEPGGDLLYYLARKSKEDSPFLLWYHYLATHLPYQETGAGDADFLELTERADQGARPRLYAAFDRPAILRSEFVYLEEDRPYLDALHGRSVQEFDQWFAGFWKFYNQSGLAGNTILVVTADHGDEHGERGNVGHASTSLQGHLHREIVEIPLFVWLPERLKKSDNISSGLISTHLDIMPTLLSLLGVQIKGESEGRNLFDRASSSTWYAMTSRGGFSEKDPRHISGYEYGIQQEQWKLLWYQGAEGEERLRLYDTSTDPGELLNLARQEPLMSQALQSQLQEHIDGKVLRPVHLETNIKTSSAPEVQWLFPIESGSYTYEQLAGRIYLQWHGEDTVTYRLQYQAGQGELALEGEVEVQGTIKEFGKLSRRYWDTWIIPYSPFRVRVAEAGKENWSLWLDLEAR